MTSNKWVLIIGGSSGIGLASAKFLASKNNNIIIVHRDRKYTLKKNHNEFEKIKESGTKLITVNTNATSSSGREKILKSIRENFSDKDKISAFVFSIADGNLKPLIIDDTERDLNTLSEDELNYTINAMGTNFLSWSKLLLEYNLFADPARIIGITSEGGQKVLPFYAAVSMAKSVMEAACRQMAVDLAHLNITCNILNPGIIDTPALRAIPDHNAIIENALRRNPHKRLTTPEDVARVIYLLTLRESAWINGEIIRVDGGEQIVY